MSIQFVVRTHETMITDNALISDNMAFVNRKY